MADDFTGANPADNLGNKVKFSGKMPPQMREAIAELRNEASQKSDTPEKKRDVTPHLSQARPTGSVALESLIESLRDTQYVFEEIELPSKGAFYDGKDGPKDGKLHLRAMTGEEEQILATPRFVRKGQAINMIFQRCLQESYRTDDFLSADRTFLLIWLRGISYTPEYEVEVKCPNCTRKFSTTLNLNSLHVRKCPSEFRGLLSDVLPKSKFKFNYRLSRGRDEGMVQDYRDRNLKMFGDSGADDTLIYRTALLLEDVEGLTDKNELIMLLKKLPIQDVSYMRNLITDPPFGVDTKIEINCVSCTEDFEIDLPLEANFFFPRSKKKDKTQA